MKCHSPVSSTRNTGSRRRGFTFMEILFAVMILGIGFIMVAAMFPAALRQTQGNIEENEFNVICRTAAQDMDNLAYCTDPQWAAYVKNNPPTGSAPVGQPPKFLDRLTGWVADAGADPALIGQWPQEYDAGSGVLPGTIGRPIPFSFHDPRISGGTERLIAQASFPNRVEYGSGTNPTLVDSMWDLVRGNMIITDHRQDGWIALWSRSQKIVNGNHVAGASLNLFIFPVHSRAKPQYDPYATVSGSNPATAARNPSCDLTYNQTNMDPALITIQYTPPSSTPNINAPNGVLMVNKLLSQANAAKEDDPTNAAFSAANPVTEGCYVVVSDANFAIVNDLYPRKYNGMIFKVGPECASTSGAPGTSKGQYWSVAQVINLPSEPPFNITDPSKIPANAFSNEGIQALVIGRQPDPADAVQQSDSVRKGKSFELLNRKGPAQELGYFPWSVVVK